MDTRAIVNKSAESSQPVQSSNSVTKSRASTEQRSTADANPPTAKRGNVQQQAARTESPQRATLLKQEKNLIDAAVAEEGITSQVRISEYCTNLIPLVKVLLAIGYKTHRQMPLPKGFKNFVPNIAKKGETFTKFLATYGINYHVETTCIRITVLQHCGHLLLENAQEKANQLQGVTYFIWNLYLNKGHFPFDFWTHV